MNRLSLNKSWRFHLGDPGRRFWRNPDSSTWRTLDLPHDWSIELERTADAPSTNSGGYFQMGRGYYVKTFTAPEEWRGKKVLVEFEGVYMNAEVRLNEHYLGRHPYGYTTFTYDLTPFLQFGQENTLRVVVDNSGQMNSRWYSGSGIYRPAWLLVGEPVHIAHWGVYVTTPEVSPEAATVRVQTRLANASGGAKAATLRSRVIGPDGATLGEAETQVTVEVGDQTEAVQEIQVQNPQLWSPETPHLYRLESEVSAEGQAADLETTTFGIRTIEVDAERGFVLNGQSIKLRGGCVHHDNGVMGAAAFPRAEERKVALHKASGYNAIRCAHNPPSPAFLEACDRLGMLVMDEAFDCWRTGKNPFDYHVAFDDWWERDISSMVRRDRNHPSVVIWSIGNEVQERDGRSNGAAIAHMLATKVRELDPTRPVTSAINGVHDPVRTWQDTDAVFAELDLGGYNYQWQQYLPDHERHPKRVMAGTESFPLEAFENWKMVRENSFVVGDFVWTSMDYLGEAGIGRVHFEPEKQDFLGEYPWHQAYCGDIDLVGIKRPQSYYRDIVWGVGDPLYIAVHAPVPEGQTPIVTRWGWPDVANSWTWPGQEGKTMKVDVYSACEEVELFLNGRSLGRQALTPGERPIASFEAPYEPGELKVTGYNGGQPAAESAVRTAGQPTAIRLVPDLEVIKADGWDLAYVTAEVVDEQGCVHPNADNTLFFTVQGAGEIAAVGNGNPVSTEMYRGNMRKAHRGQCLVVVKAKDEPGEIILRAQADGLNPAEVRIKAE